MVEVTIMTTKASNIVYLFHRPAPIVWGDIVGLYVDYYSEGGLSFHEFRQRFNALSIEFNKANNHI